MLLKNILFKTFGYYENFFLPYHFPRGFLAQVGGVGGFYPTCGEKKGPSKLTLFFLTT